MGVTLEVGQLWEWTEGSAGGMRLVRALRIKTAGPWATATVIHWRGRPSWVGRAVLWPQDKAHLFRLVTAEEEQARQSKPVHVRRKSALKG